MTQIIMAQYEMLGNFLKEIIVKPSNLYCELERFLWIARDRAGAGLKS
jgi:hypothetical protein